MKIKKICHDFSVCQLSAMPKMDIADEFFFAKTDEEISLVCSTEHVPDSVTKREDGWKAFRVEGVLDFSLVGILAKIATLLADNNISIFAISTFNTDYILTKAEHFAKALSLLENAGYEIL